MKIHKKTPESKISKAFTLVELLVGIAIVGILASMLLPALARAKAKTARVKCVNNLGQIGKAFIGFANDYGGRLPWQLTPMYMDYHFGGNYVEDLGPIFSTAPMKGELQTAKILWSPCDAEREAANEDATKGWSGYNAKTGNLISNSAISYVLIKGADTGRPSTILSATRNLSACDLATAKWAGADENPIPDHAMAGLNKSQGQLVLADGSAKQSTDADLGSSGKIVKGHINSSGGVTLGKASTAVIGCGGDEEKEVWFHVVGVYDRRKNQIRCYLDGIKRGTKRCTIINRHRNPTFIGVWMVQSPQHRGSRLCVPFKGKIDDVSFFNRALTDDEVTGLFESGSKPITRGLKAYYPFNGNARDESGNGKNGILRGPKLTKDRFGKNNAALYFDGDDYVKISRPIITNNSDSYTVSAWVLPDEGFSTGMIVSDRPGPGGRSEGYKYYLYLGMGSKPSISFAVHNASPWRFVWVSGN